MAGNDTHINIKSLHEINARGLRYLQIEYIENARTLVVHHYQLLMSIVD